MKDFANKVLEAELGKTHIFSVGQAGYIIKSSSGQLLAIDLYLSDCVERIEGHVGFKRLLPHLMAPNDLLFDVIVCTHPHVDHFDIDAIPQMISERTKLLCSIECEKLVRQLNMECHDENIDYIKPGDCVVIGDFDIRFVECDHGKAAPDAVGIVVLVDGHSIYEAGDTCLHLEYKKVIVQPLDVLIAPINGKYGNMDEEECTMLAEALKPKLTIPCHYGMFASHHGDVGRFYDIMSKKQMPFLLMAMGEQYTF